MKEVAGSRIQAMITAWRAFAEQFRASSFRDHLAARLGESPARATELTETYLAEAEVGLRFVAPHLAPELRVLEIGAGMGLLSSFLAERGFRMTALEPDDGGFGFMAAANAAVREFAGGHGACRFLEIGAEGLRPEAHGSFDLIYSVHVLEHVADLPLAMRAMAAVLAPGGRMVHLCPNYAVPYEPHLAIPLIPFAPRATARIFPKVIRRHQPVWDALGFVTARTLTREARRLDLQVTFARGVMWQFIERLRQDPAFAKRHRGLVPLVLRGLRVTGLLALIRHLPPELQTPMVTVLTRPGRKARGSGLHASRLPSATAGG